MIVTALLLLRVHVMSIQGDLPKASDLIGAMFRRYYNANTIKGHIKYTVTAAGQSGGEETDLQLERPGKLFIRQVKVVSGKNLGAWIVTADGSNVSYPEPRGRSEFSSFTYGDGTRLQEPIGPDKALKDLKDAFCAATLSIDDRSAPMDIAVGRPDDMKRFSLQLATLKTQQSLTYAGQDSYVIGGDWKVYGDGPVVGKYQLIISKNGDLLRYVISQVLSVPNSNLPPTKVERTYDVTYAVDGPVDQSLFTVLK